VLADGSKGTSASEGTLLSIAPGSASASQTFSLGTVGTITSGGAAVSSWSFRRVPLQFSGNKKDFSVALSGTSLTVTFHPTSLGTKTIDITVNTSDSAHPAFRFRVQGVTTTPYVDLAASFGVIKPPKNGVLSGSSQTISVPVFISSGSNAPIPAHSLTNIQLFVALNGDANNLVRIAFKDKINVSHMSPGGHIRVDLSATLPQSLVSGSYSLVAQLNNSGVNDQNVALATVPNEVVAGNDTASTGLLVTVTQGTFGLAGSVASSSLVAPGGSIQGGLVLNLHNTSNVPFAAAQSFNINVIAHPAALPLSNTSGDVALTSTSTGRISVGGSRTVNINVPATAAAAGSYIIETLVTPSPSITLNSGTNLLIDSNSLGQLVTLTVA
jgi:hypothetical protein